MIAAGGAEARIWPVARILSTHGLRQNAHHLALFVGLLVDGGVCRVVQEVVLLVLEVVGGHGDGGRRVPLGCGTSELRHVIKRNGRPDSVPPAMSTLLIDMYV